MIGYTRITKSQFYKMGAFSNPRLVRKELSKAWSYWQRA